MIYIFDIDGVLADDSLTRDLDCTREKDRAEFTRLVPTLAPRPDAVRMAAVNGQCQGCALRVNGRCTLPWPPQKNCSWRDVAPDPWR